MESKNILTSSGATMTQPYITLILPAYNEAATIANTLSQTIDYFSQRKLAYELIVAADGNDGTREIAREFALNGKPVRVIGSEARGGKGRGIREAVQIATGEIIGYADADNKVPIEEFEKITPWLQGGHSPLEDPYEVVIGSRALARSVIEKSQPLYRRIGSKGFYFFMKLVTGLPKIQDTQCGFKFFTRHAAKEIFGRQVIDGYMFDVEILTLANKLGFRIKEVAIRWHDDGDSRLQLFSGNVRNVVDIFRIGASKWSGHSRSPAGHQTADSRRVL